MSLEVAQVPKQVIDVVTSTLGQFATGDGFDPAVLDQAQQKDLSLSTPHPVYLLTRDPLLRDHERPLDAAQFKRWRFLIMQGDTVISSAEVAARSPEDVKGLEFSNFTDGPFVDATTRAIFAAEADERVQDGEYILRLLTVPSLYVTALWLKEEGGADLLMPLVSAPEPLDEGVLYDIDRFVDALRTAAKAFVPTDNRPEKAPAPRPRPTSA